MRFNMNIMSMDIILIFVLAVICAGLVKGTCPSTCSCVDDSSGSNVNCYSKYLGRIPTLPKDTYYLDLRHNHIADINIQFCKEMPQLQHLYISYNLITEIPEITFADCEQLYRIYLYNNKIRSLVSYTFINLTNLYELELSGNPLNCDCSIFPFWSWLIERASLGTTAKCSNGTLVTSLQSVVLDICH
ncbi:Hypothetical predicted protein, partial [Mytilus galloprovincialis]